jgi:hypothetical protein
MLQFHAFILSAEDGTVVNCSTCPTAVHSGCVKNCSTDGVQTWQCRDCTAGRRPVYGEVVWAKVGNYRFVSACYSMLKLNTPNYFNLFWTSMLLLLNSVLTDVFPGNVLKCILPVKLFCSLLIATCNLLLIRWWPAEICSMKSISSSVISSLPHKDHHHFVVRLFGCGIHYWITRGR